MCKMYMFLAISQKFNLNIIKNTYSVMDTIFVMEYTCLFTYNSLFECSCFLLFIFMIWSKLSIVAFKLKVIHNDIQTQIKETVHPELEICWKSTHAQAIKDVSIYLSIYLSEQIWKNLASHYLLINGSFAVNGCRQNESPNKSIIEKF